MSRSSLINVRFRSIETGTFDPRTLPRGALLRRSSHEGIFLRLVYELQRVLLRDLWGRAVMLAVEASLGLSPTGNGYLLTFPRFLCLATRRYREAGISLA